MRILLSIFSFRGTRLTKLIIIAIIGLVLYQTLTTIRRKRTLTHLTLSSDYRTNSLAKASFDVLGDNVYSTKQEQVKTRGLNVHIWNDVCPSAVQALCDFPLFPKAPNAKTFITTLDLSREQSNYAQRIFGFLHPSTTGKYRFAIAADDFSELWLSPSDDPSEAVLLCSVREYTGRGEFQRSPSQISRQIELQQNRKYYIEVIHAQFGGDDFVHVVWSEPSMNPATFKTIPINSTSLFFNDTGTLYNYDMAPSSVACRSRQHHQHSLKPETKKVPVYLTHDMVADVLPYCNYKPSYLTKTKMPDDRPKNVYKFLSSHYLPVESFPPVEYQEVVNELSWFGDHHLDVMAAQKAAKLYMDSLHQRHPGKFKILELANVERKHDKQLGNRFLLEFLVEVKGQEQPVMISEFVFWPKDNDTLCYPKGLQWNRQANIALVITVKNQGRWMVHFLNNLEEIYAVTKDQNVRVVIFNYNSSDIDLEHELAVRTLPPYTVVSFEAEHYSRSRSLNKAVQQVHDPRTIIFTLDLHLELPNTLFDDVRKHCFEGRSVYTPVIIRLDCGESSATPRGRWEPYGFGLAGIYKSDWDRIRGLNEKVFDLKWGGEDWDFMEKIVSVEMEYDRVRHPKIFHYYHTKHGLWTGDQ